MSENRIDGGEPTPIDKHLSISLLFQPEWCRVTLASIGDAVITMDTEGRVTFLNPVAQSLTNWTQEEAASQSIDSVFRIINEESRQTVESPPLRALREGAVVRMANHTVLIAKDGTERLIDDSAAPIRNEKGEVVGVVMVFRDISERSRLEQQVQNALDYANDIIATLREPFLILDKSLRIQTANAAFYNTFHVSKEETEGRYIYDLGNSQWNIPRLREFLEEIIPKNHSFQDFEVEHDFLTIGRKIMLLNARRFVSVNGRPELILLAIEDISERSRLEQQVQNALDYANDIIATLREPFLILDKSLRIQTANAAFYNTFHVSKEETEGRYIYDLGNSQWNIPRLREFLEEIIPKNHSFQDFEVEHDFVTIGRKIMLLNARRFVSVNSRPELILLAIEDISERRRLEKQTNALAAELSDLHRRKDEFLAMLSHELRNPIAPILNAVRLLRLQQRNENPIQQQSRTIIERQVGVLKHLVDDLLEISRITTGSIHLRQERVAISGIVEDAVETVRPLIDQRRHELTVSLLPEPIWLYADSARLEQVVVNLLTNAVKYTEEGGHIWLTVQQEGNECLLLVRDTGIGIARELLPHIFDLFTQSERSLDRSQGGLGIGLCLVQRLTELHGGTVKAYSTLGQGSEFVVHLPVMLTAELQQPSQVTVTSQQTAQPLRVLVVDDNIDSALSLKMLMEAIGHDVRMIHDGSVTLKAALDYRPNVVLLDIGLPGLNGFEVAKQIRLQPVLQSVMLVAMTGYGQETDRHRSQEAGFDHHLVKPVDFDKVEQLLATISDKVM